MSPESYFCEYRVLIGG